MRFRRLAATAAIIAVVGTIAAPAGAAEGARGTGDASITGLSVDVGDLASIDLVELSSLATRDADRAGVTQDLAEGTLSLAGVALSDFAELSIPPEPITVRRSADNPGSDEDSRAAQTLRVPGDVSAASVAADRGSVIDLVNSLAGSSAPAIADGGVLAGSLEPLDLQAVFDDVQAAFSGGSRVADASALGGLVSLDGFGVTEQESWSEVDQAGAAIRGASLDELTVLDLEAFLHLLGLSLDDLSLAHLTALAGELALDPTGALGDLDLSTFDTWEAVRAQLDETRSDLQELVDLGETCDELTDPLGDLLGDAGVVCDELEEALDDVNDLLDDLLDAVEGVLSGAALLTIEDVAGEVRAVAEVDETATALTSALARGSVGDIKVGEVSIGSIDVDLTQDPLSTLQSEWNELGVDATEALDDVVGTLGSAFEGLVEVQAVPVAVQNTGIDGQYATAEARLSLLKVEVTLPDSLPDPTDLVEGLDDGGTTTTSSTTTTTQLPDLGLISNVRPAGEALGQSVPLGQSVTVEVGVLSASAEHTREVEITSGGENRTFDSRTGFGDGPTPRTGGETGLVLLIAAVLVTAGWFGRRALARGVPSA